ncbi:hypothetical protein J2Z40_002794, partial [Cytobacillus eiseniae]
MKFPSIIHWLIIIIAFLGSGIIIYAMFKAPSGDEIIFAHAGLIFGLVSIIFATLSEVLSNKFTDKMKTELNEIRSQLNKIEESLIDFDNSTKVCTQKRLQEIENMLVDIKKNDKQNIKITLFSFNDYGHQNVPPLTYFLPPNDKKCTSQCHAFTTS